CTTPSPPLRAPDPLPLPLIMHSAAIMHFREVHDRREVHDQREKKGGQREMPTYLVSRYSSMPSAPPSRPKPDCLTPPKGAAGLETIPWLRPTMPVSRPSTTRKARFKSFV